MKRKQAAQAPTVNECPQCTTPQRCGRKDLSGSRGQRCIGRAAGLDDCDCLNSCGDDPRLEKGKSKPCARRAAEEATAIARRTAGPAEYASWFPIGVHVPRATRMPVERIAMLWNSLPLETDPASVVAFARAIEDFAHGERTCDTAHQQLMKFYGVDSLAALVGAQARHVEKLQAKLPPAPSLAPHRVREG